MNKERQSANSCYVECLDASFLCAKPLSRFVRGSDSASVKFGSTLFGSFTLLILSVKYSEL